MPKDKLGNELTYKEYMSRWKQGITNLHPYQTLRIQIFSNYIIMFGLLSGIVISLIGFKNLWWLFFILLGGLFNQAVTLLSLYSNYKISKENYKFMQEVITQ